ncbi:MAG TPA: carboxypeptidase-like regulatory domain-containing protein [Verrucomicrobiae bacterium]|nr:carboxypeptidase-like regulatory domain-containing protein [Verrucomicrobiae bacterium]
MRPTQPLAWPFVRRTSLKLAIVLAAASWTMGCVPMRYTSGPAAKGRVVDASTQAPIKGAFVTLTRAEGNAAQTSTAKDGEFHIRSKHSWYMLNLFRPSSSKPIPQPAMLTIDSSGYQSFATNSAPDATMLNVGEIKLQPLP